MKIESRGNSVGTTAAERLLNKGRCEAGWIGNFENIAALLDEGVGGAVRLVVVTLQVFSSVRTTTFCRRLIK